MLLNTTYGSSIKLSLLLICSEINCKCYSVIILPSSANNLILLFLQVAFIYLVYIRYRWLVWRLAQSSFFYIYRYNHSSRYDMNHVLTYFFDFWRSKSISVLLSKLIVLIFCFVLTFPTFCLYPVIFLARFLFSNKGGSTL